MTGKGQTWGEKTLKIKKHLKDFLKFRVVSTILWNC